MSDNAIHIPVDRVSIITHTKPLPLADTNRVTIVRGGMHTFALRCVSADGTQTTVVSMGSTAATILSETISILQKAKR